jgi:ribosomal protein S18 acetylase RimI-like enzyme
MQELTVRRATLADLDAVAVLFDAYRQFYDMPADLPLARRFLHARLEGSESVIFLARGAGQEAGFCQLYPTFCSVLAARMFTLYDLFVAPAARRSGCGHMLLRAAEDYAREQGAARMELQTAKTNTGAQLLYERSGWVRDEVFFVYSRSFLNVQS